MAPTLEQAKEKSLLNLILILALAIVLLIITLIVSIVVLIYVKDIHNDGCKVMDGEGSVDDADLEDENALHGLDFNNCDDIAIVGAGPGGAYTAYKLRNKGLKISVYEQLNRIGGRLHSIPIPGLEVKAEMGAMRFLPSHERLIETFKELDIETRPFVQSGPNDRVYHLRGENFRQPELPVKDVPYFLRPDEKNKYFRGILLMYNKQIFGTKEPKPHMTNRTDGVPMWELGYTNELQKRASSEALRFVLDTGIYDIQNLEILNGDYHPYTGVTVDKPSSHGAYQTVVNGFDTLPKKLIKRFLDASDKNSLHLNNQVKALELLTTKPEKLYKLRIKDLSSTSKTWKNVCAKKVVLVLTSPNLKKIWWEDNIKGQFFDDHVDSVVPTYSQKTFFAYDRPWWRTDPKGEVFSGVDNLKHAVTDLPNRQVLDMYGHTEGLQHTGKSLLLVAYPTSVAAFSFRDMILHNSGLDDRMIPSDPGNYVTKALVEQHNNFLARIFNISETDLPQPYAAVTQYFGDDPWHGAAYHYWRPGYKWADVMDKMVKPSKQEEIYICGEAFSAKYQGWTEGVMDTCDLMLEKMGL